ncbi:MAG TPA: alpha-2-macroglobulin family protein, partial [Anaerolineales bacterium]|nr:alpha-2-macroglobulin family protein [Anaerolineales bacterium]
GRGGGGGDMAGSGPRADFRDTAAWFPALRTDSNGRATVTFTLPDNLTSWRLSAKAITLNHLVGQSHTNIETKNELLLRPLLPRILTTGDQAQLTTMVHNYSDTPHNVQVTLTAPGLKINGDATQTVWIKANEVQAVGWSAVPETATETNVTFVAVTDSNLEDSISLPLPVQPLAIKDVQSISGKFNGAVTLPLPLPPDVMTETSVITLKLSRTPASTILDGLEYLTGYPYGCVEQTMSRAMPNAVLGRASAQLGIGGEEFQSRTKPLIEASIQKLYGLQHSDGGWGWWYDDYSDAYQTAWVLHGLSNIHDAGYFIDPQVLERGSKYLSYNLSGMDIRTRAYALYSMALAGHGDLNQTIDLMNTSLTQLDPFSQAALALTFHQLGEETQADTVLNQLQKSVNQKGDLAYWSQSTEDGQYHRKTMSSTIRTTAMALSAFMQIRGASPLTDSLANYLTENRTGYGWGTTNETSFTILALTDYLAGKQEYSGSSEFTVEVNNNIFTDGTFQTGNLFTSIDIPLEDLQSGLNNIKLSTSGTDPLYYDIITSYMTQKTASQAAGNITLTRRYLDPKTNKPLEEISEGQLVKVELMVNMPENASFVIVEDHLPGGLEALNESLNSTTQDTINYEYDYYEEMFFWQDYGYNYKEIHGDRVSFFITELKQGSRTFKYLARATTSGTFTALPAEAYAMYDEQIWGRSASAPTTILP